MTDLPKPDDLRKTADDPDMAEAEKMLERMKAEEAEHNKLTAQIMGYPGGMFGTVGLSPSWDR